MTDWTNLNLPMTRVMDYIQFNNFFFNYMINIYMVIKLSTNLKVKTYLKQ